MRFYLAAWRDEKKVTQAEVARRIGVTKGAICRLENGSRRWTQHWIENVSRALQITPEQLMHPPGGEPANQNIKVRPKRNANQNSRGGCLTMFSENPTEESIKLFAVVGDEMKPTMKPGDAVLVNTAQRIPTPAGLFLIDEMGQPVVRRLQMITQHDVRVASDNPIYQNTEGPVDQLEIIGRVVAHVAQI